MDSFRETYPALDTALGGEFHDSDTGDDLAIAKGVRGDLDQPSRARFITNLIEEAQLALGNISESWQPIATDANRCLYTEEATREWLKRLVVVWKEELERIRRA